MAVNERPLPTCIINHRPLTEHRIGQRAMTAWTDTIKTCSLCPIEQWFICTGFHNESPVGGLGNTVYNRDGIFP
jgi:hypothetical protein